MVQLNGVLKGFEAADALAVQSQLETTLGEEAVFELLNLEIISQRLLGLEHFVACVQVQFVDWQFALQANVVRLQMAEIDK
jgi:hypothetical protein